jgi:hypothetical protein
VLYGVVGLPFAPQKSLMQNAAQNPKSRLRVLNNPLPDTEKRPAHYKATSSTLGQNGYNGWSCRSKKAVPNDQDEQSPKSFFTKGCVVQSAVTPWASLPKPCTTSCKKKSE